MALLEIQLPLLQRLVLVEQRLPFGRPLLVARLGAGEVVLEATELHLRPIMARLQTAVPLLERFVLVEQRLPIHCPLQLGVLHLVELLLLCLELALDQLQLFGVVGKLRAHIVLQGLQVRDELLVLLQDVGE